MTDEPTLDDYWHNCKHCSAIICYLQDVNGFCMYCAEKIIANLSETTIANVWKMLDSQGQKSANERANRDRLHD
jgi:hypothetical protein